MLRWLIFGTGIIVALKVFTIMSTASKIGVDAPHHKFTTVTGYFQHDSEPTGPEFRAVSPNSVLSDSLLLKPSRQQLQIWDCSTVLTAQTLDLTLIRRKPYGHDLKTISPI